MKALLYAIFSTGTIGKSSHKCRPEQALSNVKIICICTVSTPRKSVMGQIQLMNKALFTCAQGMTVRSRCAISTIVHTVEYITHTLHFKSACTFKDLHTRCYTHTKGVALQCCRFITYTCLKCTLSLLSSFVPFLLPSSFLPLLSLSASLSSLFPFPPLLLCSQSW